MHKPASLSILVKTIKGRYLHWTRNYSRDFALFKRSQGKDGCLGWI